MSRLVTRAKTLNGSENARQLLYSKGYLEETYVFTGLESGYSPYDTVLIFLGALSEFDREHFGYFDKWHQPLNLLSAGDMTYKIPGGKVDFLVKLDQNGKLTKPKTGFNFGIHLEDFEGKLKSDYIKGIEKRILSSDDDHPVTLLNQTYVLNETFKRRPLVLEAIPELGLLYSGSFGTWLKETRPVSVFPAQLEINDTRYNVIMKIEKLRRMDFNGSVVVKCWLDRLF